ncbi:DUF5684 domain-containing protein [Microbacterium sp. SORGH_AS_0421]|uniref:DUF5684 domain-containing protein n=1 Tax=Microbacterium sp. SORGH_AS_0421 TaxID=3041768 RepID=UPI0027915A37|nr:DUF5684 domain-containing protein [Microbacterium sp. SORGH_AS_0421]MDQ1176819.1 hypothetical protein [Microbacterium sp. SORGH_AS_0421]
MTDSTMVVLGATSFALVVVLYIWLAIALAALFRKIGEPAWKAWVPVLNVATVLKAGGFSPWLVLLNFVPIFGFVAFVAVFIVAVHRINTGFGVGAGLTVVGALFPVVWASILGFGSARWHGERRTALPDENSAPVRRGKDYEGPYVPLIGGWTPEQVPEHSSPDAAAPLPPLAPVSAPVAVPFAAPSPSLADAVPSSSDWAPPAHVPPPAPERARADEEHRAESRDVAPATSVFAVLDALRDGSPEDDHRPAAPAASEPPRPHVLDAPSAAAPAPIWAPPVAPPAVPEARASSELPAEDAEEDSDVVAPWANPPRRTTADAGPAPIADVPLTRPAPDAVPAPHPSVAATIDEFPELSEAVSAVAEAPDAGSPRSARTSVSALYTQPEVPSVAADEDFDALDRTVVTRRKRIPWALVPPSGTPIDLTSAVVILGRRPGPDSAYPDAQLVPISDETRTVSKTHARLELRGDTWYVTDLHSTNGVLFATLMGTEVEAPPGEEIEAGERFFLGDAEVRLSRSDA